MPRSCATCATPTTCEGEHAARKTFAAKPFPARRCGNGPDAQQRRKNPKALHVAHLPARAGRRIRGLIAHGLQFNTAPKQFPSSSQAFPKRFGLYRTSFSREIVSVCNFFSEAGIRPHSRLIINQP
jgi:hypothetical protein